MSTLTIIQVALFVITSLGFFLYSKRYLTNPRAHGYYRFFGWEMTLFLIVINLPVWFADPGSPRQVISWILLLLSIVVALVGFIQLVKRGKPSGSFENTSIIVANGLYRYLRHPLYASLILGTWGVALKNPDLLSLVITLAATMCYYLTARVEEEEMLDKFGDAYREYIKHTKRFLPFIF